MKYKMTPALLVAIVFMAALVYLFGNTESDSDSRIGQKLYPELNALLESVDKISILTSDHQATIEKTDGMWKVADRDGYPASFEILSQFLDSLQQARYQEKKTSKPENHEQMGLSDPDAENSTARGVKVFSGDQQLAALILGKSSSQLDGTYFRFFDDDQVWLMDQSLTAVANPAEWLEPGIIDIPEEDIVKVIQRNASGDSITVTRTDGAASNFMPAKIPAGKKLKYPAAANQLGRALVNVNLEDVQKAGDFDWSGANTTDFYTSKNLHLTIRSKDIEGKYYIAVTADVTEQSEQNEQAAKLSARLTPWIYLVSKITYDDFARTGSDLFDDQVKDADSSKAGNQE